jgi:hypothetical protein
MGYIDNNFNCFYMIMMMDMDMLDSCLVIVTDLILMNLDCYYS